ncbi:MAG: RNA polymerase Rpb4 [Candidatus Bathyarchaeota archaeon]|nr:RNA polymerase Rpb4 [Candidatus Bathyarchaeota archaeon]
MSVQEKKEITVAEAKRLLEERAEELDPLQRRVLDYTIRFSRLSAEDATKLVEELTGGDMLENELAVQIANSMPGSVEEVRTFLGRQRIISEETINAILGKIEKYRSSQ